MSNNNNDIRCGLQTELITLPDATKVTQHDHYMVFETPERPDYVYGNSVFFLGRSLEENRKFIDEYKTRIGPSAFLAHAEYDHDYYMHKPELKDNPDAEIVFMFNSHSALHSGKYPDKTEMREIHPDDLLDCIGDIVYEEYSEGKPDDFLIWRLQDYRTKILRKKGTWYGLHRSNELVSTCGLFSSGGFNRFQMVITKKKYRRQGYGTQLVTSVLKQQDPMKKTVILATVGSIASTMYSKIGFQKQTVILSSKI